MINFKCYGKEDDEDISWKGKITCITCNSYRIHIESRSGFYVYLFYDSCGYIISIPAFNFGADLSYNLEDVRYNSNKLIPRIGYVDGITVAYALKALNNWLNITP